MLPIPAPTPPSPITARPAPIIFAASISIVKNSLVSNF
jgi:hypothetical protein